MSPVADVLIRMLPELLKLGGDLIAKHHGNEQAARAELAEMIDHGQRYLDEHARIKAKIDAALEREKP